LTGIGQAERRPTLVEGHYPIIMVPADQRIISLKDHMKEKERIEQKIDLLDIGSFTEYFNKYKTPDSKIFMNDLDDKKYLHAIFDYHSEEGKKPLFSAHQAKYHFPHSQEWLTWDEMDGEQMKQDQFAAFIEDNYLDIAEPDNATVLEISRSLEANSKIRFESAVRLQDGQRQFTYSEEVGTTSNKGQLQIPEIFTLRLRVFNRGDMYDLKARLRYRINNGALTMWYDLLRPHLVIEEAVRAIENVVTERTQQNILRGIV
jgi:uncharacterized protein YfdQ (DUF2303 family)